MQDEELEVLLGRADIPIEAQEDIDLLREYMLDFFGGTMSDAQWEGVQRGLSMDISLADHGIRFVGVRENWGISGRYGIQGLPGLWSWDTVRELREEEGW